MNTTYLRMEIVRLVRNKRVVIFSMLMPALLLLIIGGVSVGDDSDAKKYVMVSMALFGAMTAALTSGSTIAVERGLGWNRTLRLTPLSPGGYVVNKVIVALLVAIPRPSSPSSSAPPPCTSGSPPSSGSCVSSAPGCRRCPSPRSASSSATSPSPTASSRSRRCST